MIDLILDAQRLLSLYYMKRMSSYIGEKLNAINKCCCKQICLVKEYGTLHCSN